MENSAINKITEGLLRQQAEKEQAKKKKESELQKLSNDPLTACRKYLDEETETLASKPEAIKHLENYSEILQQIINDTAAQFYVNEYAKKQNEKAQKDLDVVNEALTELTNPTEIKVSTWAEDTAKIGILQVDTTATEASDTDNSFGVSFKTQEETR